MEDGRSRSRNRAAVADDQFAAKAKQIAMQHSTGTAWLSGWQGSTKIAGSDGDNPKLNKSPLAIPTNAEGKFDWFLALKRVDYRVGVTIVDAHTVKYQFQILKYYSFDAPFNGRPFTGGFSKDEWQRLNASGLAHNCYITGLSDPIMVSYR